MDAKQIAMLGDLHARIVAGDFGETDVVALLSLLREDAPAQGAIRELGNFAHRQRDKGPVHTYVCRLKAFLDNFRKGIGGQVPNLVFTETEIAAALHNELQRYRLGGLTLRQHRQVQLVILATLQGVVLVDDRKQQIGTLCLMGTSEVVRLAGTVPITTPTGATNTLAAPVLEVVNEFGVTLPPGIHRNGVVHIAVRRGVLHLQQQP